MLPSPQHPRSAVLHRSGLRRVSGRVGRGALIPVLAATIAIVAIVAACSSGTLAPAPVTPSLENGLETAATPTIRTPAPPTATPTPKPTPTRLTNAATGAACLAAPTGGPFLSTNGQWFTCTGRPLRLTGYTFYPALVGGARAWRSASFRGYIDHVLDMGVAAGQNLIRATDQWDPHATGQRYDDPVIWSNMDYLVAAARSRGMFVVMDLSAYRWLLQSQGRDPWDASLWISYINFVAARYRDDGNVAFYSISGEPSAPKDANQLASLLAFYSSTSNALSGADPNHLITVGGFNHMEDSPSLGWWQAIDRLPHNDIVAFKTYSQHDLDLMPAIADFASSAGRVAFDEEFGMPQEYGDASFSGGQPYNGVSTGRAKFFGSVYSRGDSLGLAGFVFWNMGCQVGPTSYEVNPQTPATWAAVTSHGALEPAVTSSGDLCAG